MIEGTRQGNMTLFKAGAAASAGRVHEQQMVFRKHGRIGRRQRSLARSTHTSREFSNADLVQVGLEPSASFALLGSIPATIVRSACRAKEGLPGEVTWAAGVGVICS